MKKLILAIAFLGFAIATTNAQTPAAAPAAEKKQSMSVKKAAPKAETMKADAPKTDAKAAPAKKADASGTVMKKDGTPDKRYKASKPANGPMKKDGTPDKRFKANKEAKPATK